MVVRCRLMVVGFLRYISTFILCFKFTLNPSPDGSGYLFAAVFAVKNKSVQQVPGS
jgi:hypothetical protein